VREFGEHRLVRTKGPAVYLARSDGPGAHASHPKQRAKGLAVNFTSSIPESGKVSTAASPFYSQGRGTSRGTFSRRPHLIHSRREVSLLWGDRYLVANSKCDPKECIF